MTRSRGGNGALSQGTRRTALARATLSGLVGLVLFVSARASADETDEPSDVAPPPSVEPAPNLAPVSPAPVSAPDRPGAAAVAPTDPVRAAMRSARTITTRLNAELGAYQDTTATTVFTPSIGATVESPTAGWGVSGRYLVDVVSAASPDIVATASPRWQEVRNAGGLGAKYKPGNYGVAASGAVSYTPDYLSLSGGGQLLGDFDQKNLSLLVGYTYGHDTIGRTGTPFSVFSRDLSYHALSAGLSRVVNPSLVVGVYGDLILERGDQSKPYRYVPIFAADVAKTIERGAPASEVAAARIQARPLEQLPLERNRWAITGRLAWRGDRTTLRVEERLYTDTWGLYASTTDARYFIDVATRITVWPHARFHVQNAVDFWQRAYVGSVTDLPAFRTGDRELGALSNLGLGGGVKIALGPRGSVDDWVITTSFDGTWTSFHDALYVKDRLSGLLVVGLGVTF